MDGKYKGLIDINIDIIAEYVKEVNLEEKKLHGVNPAAESVFLELVCYTDVPSVNSPVNICRYT